MSALTENLKNKSFGRILFAIGMAVAFIGFLIPTVYVTPAVATKEEEDVSIWDLLGIDENAIDTNESSFTSDETDANPFGSSETPAEEVNPFGASAEVEAVETPAEEVAPVEGGASEEAPEAEAGKTELKNIFTAAKFFNEYHYKHVYNEETNAWEVVDAPNTAYNATFLVLCWLATLAGLVVFFAVSSPIVDIVVWVLGALFGIVASVTIPLTLHVLPVVGYFSVGGYFVLIGFAVSLVAVVIEFKNLHK